MASLSDKKRRRKKRRSHPAKEIQNAPAAAFGDADDKEDGREGGGRQKGRPGYLALIFALGIFYAATLYLAAHPRVSEGYRDFFITQKPVRADAFLRRYRDCLVLLVGVGEAQAGFNQSAHAVLTSWGGKTAAVRRGENYAAAFFRGRKIAEEISARQPAKLTLPAGLDLGGGIALAREFRLMASRRWGYALRIGEDGGGEDAMQKAPVPDTLHALVFDKRLRQIVLARFPAAHRGLAAVYLPPADSCR
jgi:hypothetical protein